MKEKNSCDDQSNLSMNHSQPQILILRFYCCCCFMCGGSSIYICFKNKKRKIKKKKEKKLNLKNFETLWQKWDSKQEFKHVGGK